MDETASVPDDRALSDQEVVARNRWFVLVDTEAGYGIWPADADRRAPALEEFDNDGFEAADAAFRRRTRQMRAYVTAPRWLARAVFILAPLWVLASASNTLWIALGQRRFGGPGSFPPAWLQETQQILYPIWLGALACLVALYLHRRAAEPVRG